MLIELTSDMIQNLDIQAEFNPPEVLQLIDNYLVSEFAPQDWIRLKYLRGKALYTMNRNKEAEEIAVECIRDGIAEDDFYILVKCHVLQAASYYSTDAEDRIRPLLEIAMEHAMESGDYELMLHAHCAFMFFLRHHSQFEQAQKQELRIAELIKRVPPSYTTASAFGSIAALYIEMSKWDTAIKYYTQALEQAQLLSMDVYQLRLLNNLGSAVCRVEDFSREDTATRLSAGKTNGT
jgi:tetratricopeptide (TPR) repeat protein